MKGKQKVSQNLGAEKYGKENSYSIDSINSSEIIQIELKNPTDEKTAKKTFRIEKHRDSYEITAFANVSYRAVAGCKGSGYEYFFATETCPREIRIPDAIDGLPVTKAAVKCIPDLL